MSKYKRLCSVMLAITVLLSSLVFQGLGVFADNQQGIINGTNVGLRSEPNTSASRLLSLNKDEIVTILETVAGAEAESGHGTTWYQVRRADGQTGYVYGFYVTVIPELNDSDFENFPESYRTSLKLLKAMYPKSTFVPDNLNITFDEAVNIQFSTAQRKQVADYMGASWRSMEPGAYNWSNGTYIESNGGWVSASKSVIAYYVDPRNFLGYDTAFMFVEQSYNATQTVDMLRSAVSGTFLANGYNGIKDQYLTDIMAAAQATGISPLVLAATIIVEQGVGGTSSLISGTYTYFDSISGTYIDYTGYYNFFNIGASGSSNQDVIKSGLETAKSKGWNTRAKAILGGAQTYADGYISKGQDTFYYKNFNYVSEYPSGIWHQYAQSIFDAYNNGLRLKNGYSNISNDNITLTFKIPVFKNMPDAAVEKPAQNSNQNNFYLTQMDVAGLSPSFDMFKYNYSLSVTGDTVIYVKVLEGASIASSGVYELNAGSNSCVIPVRAQTGYINDYTVKVTASAPCTLYVTTGDYTPPPTDPDDPDTPTKTSKGDINGDNSINGIDLAAIRLHILEIRELTGNEAEAADINSDGVINGIDLAAVRLHILEIRFIT